MRVTQEQIELVAKRGTYTLNVNPRELLLDNIGFEGFFGGGNFWVGCSAADLDDALVRLAIYPYAVISLDVGGIVQQMVDMTVADVEALRAAFFALYGLSKPNWYPPPLYPPTNSE